MNRKDGLTLSAQTTAPNPRRFSSKSGPALSNAFLTVLLPLRVVGDEHKTVALSIIATLTTGLVILLATIVVNGGFSEDLFFKYVFPMIIASVSLAVFFVFVFAKNKGKLPGF